MVETMHPEIQPVSKIFDAVVVCGMGPLELRETRPDRQKTNLVAKNVFNFLNAISAKLLVAHGGADEVIMAGYNSQKGPKDTVPTPLQRVEMATSEAQLLGKTYERAKPKQLTPAEKERANKQITLESVSTTTFGNIIQAVNVLDAREGGMWDGTLGVISAEFHGPRIEEMLKMFGVKGQYVSAERVFKRFGYAGRLYPQNNSGFTTTDGSPKSWAAFEEDTYKGQPNNYENLLHNPSYVTKYLAEIELPQRVAQMAGSLRDYISSHDPENMPPVFAKLPEAFDPSFDYKSLQKEFAAVPDTKKNLVTVPDTVKYRILTSTAADRTDTVLAAATK